MTDIKAGYGVQFVGPFVEEHRVVLDGRAIPNLTAHINDDRVVLMLDHRFMVEGPVEEVAKYIPHIVNAMAIGDGYSSYMAKSKEQPFAPVVSEIKATRDEPVDPKRFVRNLLSHNVEPISGRRPCSVCNFPFPPQSLNANGKCWSCGEDDDK